MDRKTPLIQPGSVDPSCCCLVVGVAAIQLQLTRLLDQVRVQLRYPHYNRKNDKTYLYRIRFLFAQAPLGSAAWGTRPRGVEMIDGEAFLSMLA